MSLNTNQKAMVRDQVAAAIFDGASNSDLNMLRQGLARKFGATAPQVNAVSAWLTIHANKVIESQKLDGLITPQQLIGCHYYLQSIGLLENSPASELKNLRDHYDLTVSGERLRQAVVDFSSRLSRSPGSDDTPTCSTHPPPSTAAVSTEQATGSDAVSVPSRSDDISAERRRSISGANANYDNATKQRFHQREFEYLATHKSVETRAREKILLLPGRRGLEIPGLLNLGYRPENIFGVEADREAFAELKANPNCRLLNLFHGDLLSFVRSTDQKFGAVLLDFPGPLCMKYQEVMQYLPLHSDAIVITNMMCAREQREVQERLDYTARERLQSLGRLPDGSWSPLSILDVMKSVRPVSPTSEIPATSRADLSPNAVRARADSRDPIWPIGVSRSSTLAEAIMTCVGWMRSPAYSRLVRDIPVVRLDSSWDGEVNILDQSQSVALNSPSLANIVVHALRSHRPEMEEPAFMQTVLFAQANIFQNALYSNVRQYRYRSETEGSKQFQSCFACVHTPRGEYHRWRHSAAFLGSVLLAVMQQHQSSGSERIGVRSYLTDASGRMLEADERLSGKTKLRVEVSGKVFETGLRRLLSDIWEHAQMVFRVLPPGQHRPFETPIEDL